jgi:hypothetical protein
MTESHFRVRRDGTDTLGVVTLRYDSGYAASDQAANPCTLMLVMRVKRRSGQWPRICCDMRFTPVSQPRVVTPTRARR